MKTVIGIVILTVCVGAVVTLNNLSRDENGKSALHVAAELELVVETKQPQQRNIIRTVQAPGDVEAFAEVDISSEVVSKILQLPVKEGQEVKKGDLLCRLDDADYKARVLSSQANVAKLKAMIVQAQAEMDKAQRDVDRQRRLSELHATSSIEMADYLTTLIRAKSTLEVRKQELIEAEAMLASAEEDLAKTVITSPISGIISQLFAEEGEVVITGTMNNPGTRIMVVSDLSVMQVRCRVDETDAALVDNNQPARIYLQSDTRKSIPGHVSRVATKGTRVAGRDVVTFETLVMITSDDSSVKPGMTANVEIEVANKENVVTIPIEAVLRRKPKDLPEEFVESYRKQQEQTEAAASQHLDEYIKLVYCMVDGLARPRLVKTGISDTRRVEILEGITLNDTVVTGPYRSLDLIKDGSKLKLEEKKKKENPTEETVTDPQPAQETETAVATPEANENA